MTTTIDGITIKFARQNAMQTIYSIEESGKETVYHAENRSAEYTITEALENFIELRELYGDK